MRKRTVETCPHTPNCFLRIDEQGPCEGFNEPVEQGGAGSSFWDASVGRLSGIWARITGITAP